MTLDLKKHQLTTRGILIFWHVPLKAERVTLILSPSQPDTATVCKLIDIKKTCTHLLYRKGHHNSTAITREKTQLNYVPDHAKPKNWRHTFNRHETVKEVVCVYVHFYVVITTRDDTHTREGM